MANQWPTRGQPSQHGTFNLTTAINERYRPSSNLVGGFGEIAATGKTQLPDDLEADLAKMHERLYGVISVQPVVTGDLPPAGTPSRAQPQQFQPPPPPPALLRDVSALEKPTRPRTLDWVVTQPQPTNSEILANPAVAGDEMHQPNYQPVQRAKSGSRSPRQGGPPPAVVQQGKKTRKQPDGSTEMDPLTGAWNDSATSNVIPPPEAGDTWLDKHKTWEHTTRQIESMKGRFKEQYSVEKREEAAFRRDRRRARTPCGRDGWMVGATGRPHSKNGSNKMSAKELMEHMNARTSPSPKARAISPIKEQPSAQSATTRGGLTSRASTTAPSSFGTSRLDQVKCRVPTRYVKMRKPPMDAGLLTHDDWERIQHFSNTPWSDPYQAVE